MSGYSSGSLPDETWSVPVMWLVFLSFLMAVMVAVGVWISVQTFMGRGGPPEVFLVFWLAALAWNVYWWLFRLAYRVDLIGGALHWRAPLRAGTMPVASIESAGRLFMLPDTCVLRASGYTSLTVFTQLRSFTPMLCALNHLNPRVSDQL